MMVAPWVLLLMISTSAMTTIQFETEAACERARSEIVARYRADRAPFPAVFTALCVRGAP